MATAHERREAHDRALREQYAAHEAGRAAELADLFASLPAAEQQDIKARATAKAGGFSGMMQSYMIDLHTARITAERHGQPIQTFDEWKAYLAA